jgi:hypothetical protein
LTDRRSASALDPDDSSAIQSFGLFALIGYCVGTVVRAMNECRATAEALI